MTEGNFKPRKQGVWGYETFIFFSSFLLNMYDATVVKETEAYVKKTLEGEGSGHDWWHITRVHKLAKHIQKKEGGDLYIIELAALLHDIADWKFHGGDEMAGARKATEFLTQQRVDGEVITHVAEIIATSSYKGAGVVKPMPTLEGQIVQDADRIDAMGAIGVARCFAYGGNKGKLLYHPDEQPEMHQTAEAYKNNESSSLTHFYEKLLLLKERMNTKTARELAEERHVFMEQFVQRFLEEWDGKK